MIHFDMCEWDAVSGCASVSWRHTHAFGTLKMFYGHCKISNKGSTLLIQARLSGANSFKTYNQKLTSTTQHRKSFCLWWEKIENETFGSEWSHAKVSSCCHLTLMPIWRWERSVRRNCAHRWEPTNALWHTKARCGIWALGAIPADTVECVLWAWFKKAFSFL